jgi:hypothetical protein
LSWWSLKLLNYIKNPDDAVVVASCHGPHGEKTKTSRLCTTTTQNTNTNTNINSFNSHINFHTTTITIAMAASNPKEPEPLVQTTQLLSATYHSPTNPSFTTTHDLPAPPTAQTADRAAYLAALRKAATAMQEHINTELTARMDEDKARGDAKSKTADDARAEDTYGEEVPEEE